MDTKLAEVDIQQKLAATHSGRTVSWVSGLGANGVMGVLDKTNGQGVMSRIVALLH